MNGTSPALNKDAKPPDDMDVWILAGQSNMQGFARLPDESPSHPCVWNYSMQGRWELACDPLHRLWESRMRVHSSLMRAAGQGEGKTNEQMAQEEDRTRRIGVGPGLAFGVALNEATGRSVGLLPCAHGGTSLELWSPHRKSMGDASLYGAMIETVRACARPIQGVLWYQGESDCVPDLADTYAVRLEEFIRELRKDLGEPDLPFIAVQLGRVVDAALNQPDHCWDTVRDALGKLPGRVPRSAVTSAVDLSLDDAIHLDTRSQKRLGVRLAALAAQFARGQEPRTPRLVSAVKRVDPDGRCEIVMDFDNVEGGWKEGSDIPGFVLYRLGQSGFASTQIARARSEGSGGRIHALLTNCPDEPLAIAYGIGKNPVCRLVDHKDRPLCAFMPVAVSQG